jgi:hypothetical protein
MSILTLGTVLLLAQLSAPGNSLPQVLTPEFKTAPVKSGKTEVTVSFKVTKDYVINHTPPMTLKLTETSGVTLAKKDFTTPDKDPKSKDEYYVDIPTIIVPVTVSKPGSYSIPAQLKYFFCSKKDDFCSVQSIDIRIPVRAE